MTEDKAQYLMARDEDEHIASGQRVTDTFHMSEFFVRLDGDDDRLKSSIWRLLDIMFGHPYRTPTFDEYAMFLAFSASLRSADLSRQVGAVIARSQEVLATGANDCPKFGGGLYWPEWDSDSHDFIDRQGGRDHTRKYDSNKDEQRKLSKA
jgi:deoxycytidylate deaminase